MSFKIAKKAWLYKTPRKKKKACCIPASNVIIRDGNGNFKRIENVLDPSFPQKRQKELKQKATQAEIKIFKKLKTILKRKFKINPVFQHIIRTKKTFFILDIYIPKAKICVEIDGKHHKYDKKQVTHDNLRNSLLSEIGIKTIRVQNSEVWKDYKEVINHITGIVKLRLRDERQSDQFPPILNRD